jgi:trimeric autotransporter adhesin
LAKLQVSTNVISCTNSVIPIIALNESNDVTLQWSVTNFGTFLQIGNTLNAGTPGKYTYKPFNFSGNCILSDTIIIVIDTSKVYGDTLAVSACNSYTWNDSTYSVSGLYSKSFPRAINGCDSLTYLNLTINPSISSDTTVVACNSFTWMDSTYTASGVYVKTGMTAAGCTQSDTLRLTINPSISSDTTVVACNNFTWMDSTYTASGVYVKTGVTAAGCTQSDTLRLTINPSISSDTTVVACNSFTWMDSTYTASGVYVKTGVTAAGCTQSDTLRLTINPSISSDTTVVACNSFTWMDSTYTASGVFVKTGVTAAGCTQSDTLNLTIESVMLSITNPVSAASVDITVSSITTGSTLPTGTVLTYHTDAEGLLTLSNPETLTIAGTYYIKATTLAGCVDIKPVVVTISNNCPDNLILVSPTDDQAAIGVVKKAGMTIIATNKVSTGANVSYQAGKSITLNPGTEISNGAVFKAEIKGCDN